MEATTAPQAPAPPDSYPVRFDVEYPERLSRWKIFLKWLFAIPQLIILYLLSAVMSVLVLIAFFSILFTKKWPRGMFDFAVQIQRWTFNVYAYLGLMRDEYPPFSGDSGAYPPVRLEIDYDEKLSRWQTFLKWVFAIPHLIVLAFLSIAALAILVVGWFAILFTGQFPRGMFDFVVGTMRWYEWVNAYAFLLMTDRYPPFALR